MKRLSTPLSPTLSAPSGSRQAFTLVEVLVGIMISSMIITAAFAAYMTATSSWKKSRQASTFYQHARVSLTLMEQYLRSALTPDPKAHIVFEGENSLELQLSESTETTLDSEDPEAALESDTLRFSSTGGPIVGGSRKIGDICELKFYLSEPSEGGSPSLMMQKNILPTEEASWYAGEEIDALDDAYSNPPAELAPNVVSFDIVYFDGYEWLEEWVTKSNTSLPRAVQITLIFASPSEGKKVVQFAKLIVLNTSSSNTEQDWSMPQA